MTLLELKERIDHILEEHPEYGKSIPQITTSDPSVGSRASVPLQNANMGFDWETGQFRLEAEVPIIRYVARNKISAN